MSNNCKKKKLRERFTIFGGNLNISAPRRYSIKTEKSWNKYNIVLFTKTTTKRSQIALARILEKLLCKIAFHWLI